MKRGASSLPAKWGELLRLIPGYDPVATAGDAWFDEAAARLALDFFPEVLRHVEGELAGKPFVLEPWEQSFVANLFGWKRKDAAGRVVRRYREALLYVPRKNGKTPLCAGLGLYVFFCDGEKGQQDYIAAGEREQAGMLFRHCKGMVEAEPELMSRCRIYGGNASAGQSKSIVREEDHSFLRVVSSDAHTKHGGNTHLAIVDELHTQADRDLIDVLTTSMASANRAQPLLIHITTADFMRPSICNEKYDYACKVRDGILEDTSFLPVIYEAKSEDLWDSEETWRKCNPNLGVSVSLEYLRRECARAKEVLAYENTFRRLHLNQRTETDVRAIPMDKWDQCGHGANPAEWREAAPERLKGKECWGGLDLGVTGDLTAAVLLFPAEDDVLEVLPFFWAPREKARQRERRDRVPYETWARQGYITLTEGDVTDYDVVRREIGALGYDVRQFAIDRWNATQITTQLQGDGLPMILFGQGFASMAAPCKRLLELVIEGKLRHGNNPVLRWMASNVAAQTDAAGNIKWAKDKSTGRIDGIVALTMALGVFMGSAGSVYESRGILTL